LLNGEQRAEIESLVDLVFSCAGVLAHTSDRRPIDFVPQAIARRPKPPINSRGLSFEEPQLSTASIIVLLGRALVTETSIVPNWQENLPITYWQDAAHSLKLRRLVIVQSEFPNPTGGCE
jgi:hypothetical protein